MKKKSKKKAKPAPKKRGLSSKKRKRKIRKSRKVTIKKKRGKQIYYIELGKKPKTEQEIDALLQAVPFNKISDQNEFVKITFHEEDKNTSQAYTDLDEYSYDSKKEFIEQIKQRCLDMNYSFHRVPAAKSMDYWKKMYRLRNYLTTIIIDLETAD